MTTVHSEKGNATVCSLVDAKSMTNSRLSQDRVNVIMGM